MTKATQARYTLEFKQEAVRLGKVIAGAGLSEGSPMRRQFRDLPAWHFDMDEVSAGVYEVVGRDSSGHAGSAKGVDLESVLEECQREARKISMRGRTDQK